MRELAGAVREVLLSAGHNGPRGAIVRGDAGGARVGHRDDLKQVERFVVAFCSVP